MGILHLFVVAALVALVGYGISRVNQTNNGAAIVGSDTMRGVYFDDYGAPSDVLHMVDLPVPTYRSWEVLVEVHAASLNPVDYKIVEGAFFLIDMALNHRPGFDFSGIVVAVGSNVKHIKVGDNVHGMTWVHKTGSLAEYLAVDESAINVIPKSMTFQEAAALPLAAHTSYSSLVTLGGLEHSRGQRVLVLGGSSATGMIALQLAKAYGASYIVATCSPRNEELVRSLGADETVNYREQEVFETMREANKSFDIIYDTVAAGKSVWDGAASGVLASGGRLITITGDVQRALDVPDLLTRGYQIVSRNLFCLWHNGGGGYHQYTQPGGKRDELMVLDSLVENGKLRAVVDKVYGFELGDVKEAFAYLMTGRASGKVIINVK